MDEVNNNSEKQIKEGVGKEPELSEVEKCQKEREEYLDGWKRAKAELLNYKKDELKRFESVIKFSHEEIFRDLLFVLDSFDLALVSAGAKEDKQSEKGLFLIQQQLEDILKKSGLERINVSADDVFDPNFHEAIMQVESDKPSGRIVEEVEKGYVLNNKVIRPSRVKVSK